ncbi:FKBP-type peptidyl-prolyl cis-trans isomerase [Ferrimonas aestuarii]|uniref:Peptidyl-prolyl cis-trans isomerase n=1 Tax=Ferrimonas aestuarii TaxID=2569539 RepID=A0A4U1BLH1_9GAMM|nr:peptidylprolyl isomerase [Ferrimonas aestuarii]TKB52829.1 peptidylprolyl isomerase [Ferrimonas aestuarii]
MIIENSAVVTIAYTLKLEDGTLVDAVGSDDPVIYEHGQGQLADGLEQVLLGHKKGDELKVTLTPDLAFGDHDPQMVQQVPKEVIKGVDELEVGMQIAADTDQGPMELTLTAIDGDTITLDANHPLAGKTVIFEVSICDVQPADGSAALQ